MARSVRTAWSTSCRNLNVVKDCGSNSMDRMKNKSWLVCAVVVLATCEVPSTPTLTVDVKPFIDGAANVSIVAKTAEGTVGSGTVEVTTVTGSIDPSSVTLDGYGTAKTVLLCDASIEAACAQRVTVTAKWQRFGR